MKRYVLLALAVIALGGCATGAHRENMVAPATPASAPTKKFASSVQVATNGGAETGAADSSNISNADLKAAIENSITRSALFRSVGASGGDYQLTVNVIQLSKPSFGASFTVDMEAGWTLVRASDKSVLMRKSIKSSHTATMGESLIGVTRLRLAVEGAAKKNIEQGLRSISDLPL